MITKYIWKHFKVGDIVKCPAIWGNKLFQVYRLSGNEYLPELNVIEYRKLNSNSNKCNFNVRDVKLYDCPKRPFIKLNKSSLIRVMNKGNVEAKREFLIRVQRNCNY